MLNKEYWTRSFNFGFKEIKLRIVVDDDEENIIVTPYVDGEEKLYFLGMDAIVEASVVIAFGNIINTTVKYNSMSFNKLGGK